MTDDSQLDKNKMIADIRSCADEALPIALEAMGGVVAKHRFPGHYSESDITFSKSLAMKYGITDSVGTPLDIKGLFEVPLQRAFNDCMDKKQRKSR